MPNRVTTRFHRQEFDRTAREYRKYSKRDPQTICNTKGFYICRRATVDTEKAKKSKIRKDLMQEGRLPAPIAALIVQSKRRAEGQPGLYGKALKLAMNALIKARKVATLAAGWIPAIKAFEPFAEKRGAPRQARLDGSHARGRAQPAREGWKAKAVFENLNSARWDTQGTANMVAIPGLEKAFAAEERSMRQYIERKMRESAQKAGIKTA